jgi:8-amino-7-oxononanoate synthase
MLEYPLTSIFCVNTIFMSAFNNHLISKYQQFLESNLYPRNLKSYQQDPHSTAYVVHDTKRLLNFSSNDYLGLAANPLCSQRSQAYTQRWGCSVSSSRLVTGNKVFFDELESDLAKSIGKPAALIMGSGYSTNASVIEALLNPSVLGSKPSVFCDRYCHSSMLVATQFVSLFKRFRHNDLNHLETLLANDKNTLKFILAESLYSMDGDIADLSQLQFLAHKYQAFLYIDDAHSVGMYGQNGWGLAADSASKTDLVMGTFSKALGGYGAYVACSELLKNYLINNCKGLIYSTGISPADAGAISAAIELVPQQTALRESVLQNAQNLRSFLSKHHLNYGLSTTHIVPWIINDAQKAMQISQKLYDAGILAVCIRPPTVPNNQSRIRFCVNALHTEQHMHSLFQAIESII